MSITVQDLLQPGKAPLVPKLRHLAMLPGSKYRSANWKVSCLQVHSGSVWFAYLPIDRLATSGLACVDLSAAATGLKPAALEAQMTSSQERGVDLRVNHFFLSVHLFLASVLVSLLYGCDRVHGQNISRARAFDPIPSVRGGTPSSTR
ncbi:hypothetical protein M407DRAFT_100880 [Tulasnella calospora MUT 4182]|uniref:Uncharacterized protein n=1 Tax=Tulasnella calospora MUT 4182 TaxID=1051891 RepID=A0A0C3LFD9_9AGAM|nr:hypothetical protein M407DRAFT_100880 [Tulasnella calospora MUT 4182]